MRKTHRIHKKIAGDKVFCAIVLTLFCLMIIFPFLNVLAISLSSRLSVSQGRVWLWPVGFNLESYKRALRMTGSSAPIGTRSVILSWIRCFRWQSPC